MRNRNFPWAIIAAAAVAGAGFAGVANYVRHDSKSSVQAGQTVDENGKTTIINDSLSGTNRPSTDATNSASGGNDHQGVKGSKVDALNKAIKDKSFNEKGIRVLDVTVENNGNAIVDMNDPVRYNWGSEEESEFIKMMTDTLAQFESIKTFQIRVDGETLKTLSHFEIDPVKVR